VAKSVIITSTLNRLSIEPHRYIMLFRETLKLPRYFFDCQTFFHTRIFVNTWKQCYFWRRDYDKITFSMKKQFPYGLPTTYNKRWLYNMQIQIQSSSSSKTQQQTALSKRKEKLGMIIVKIMMAWITKDFPIIRSSHHTIRPTLDKESPTSRNCTKAAYTDNRSRSQLAAFSHHSYELVLRSA